MVVSIKFGMACNFFKQTRGYCVSVLFEIVCVFSGVLKCANPPQLRLCKCVLTIMYR